MAKDKNGRHYVDNVAFYSALCQFRKTKLDAEAKGEMAPQVPIFIAQCIMKIATHLAYRYNFSRYTFRDEMISDGIENGFGAIKNFDPEKSIDKNAFGYFNHIIWWAFVRRIQIEKKYLYTKYKAIEHANLNGMTSDNNNNDQDGIKYSEWSQEKMVEFMHEFENKRSEKEKTKAARRIEKERAAAERLKQKERAKARRRA